MNTRAPAEVIIGLDVGTTRVKAAAFSPDGTWWRLATRGYPLLQPAPDQQVQDPGTIITAVAGAVREVVAAGGDAEVVAMSLSAGMHGLVGFDGERRPVTPLVTWADARSLAEARALHRSGQAAGLHAATGVPVHPMTPLSKLMWFAGHDRTTWDRVRWWGGLKELLLVWSTGALVTELSSASGTGLLDMASRTWSAAALDLCGLAADRLAPIEPTTATRALAPEAAAQTGLPAGTPVVVGAADGPLGNLGTGALGPGVAGLSLGTSGAVRVAVGSPRVDRDGALFCFALTDQVWIVGGAISNGGGVMRWAGGSLAPDLQRDGDDGDTDDVAVLDLAAKVPAGSEGLVMLPYLMTERAPLWDPDLPGAYLGLRRGHTRGHLVRAAVEGVCLQMRLVLDRVDAVEPVTSVRATGGTFESRLWREVMAAVLGRPLVVDDGAGGTARGAAALGLLGLGRVATLAGAAAQLGTGAAGPSPPVEVDPALVAIYDRLRASVPDLIGRLAPVARLFADAAPVAEPPPAAGD